MGVFQALSEDHPSIRGSFKDCLPAQTRPNKPNARPKWRDGGSLAKTMMPGPSFFIECICFLRLLTPPTHQQVRQSPIESSLAYRTIHGSVVHLLLSRSPNSRKSNCVCGCFYCYLPSFARNVLQMGLSVCLYIHQHSVIYEPSPGSICMQT